MLKITLCQCIHWRCEKAWFLWCFSKPASLFALSKVCLPYGRFFSFLQGKLFGSHALLHRGIDDRKLRTPANCCFMDSVASLSFLVFKSEVIIIKTAVGRSKSWKDSLDGQFSWHGEGTAGDASSAYGIKQFAEGHLQPLSCSAPVEGDGLGGAAASAKL